MLSSITPSNQTLASVIKPFNDLKNNKYEYSKAQVKFANIAGLVYLNLATEAYVGPNTVIAKEEAKPSSFWGSSSGSIKDI